MTQRIGNDTVGANNFSQGRITSEAGFSKILDADQYLARVYIYSGGGGGSGTFDFALYEAIASLSNSPRRLYKTSISFANPATAGWVEITGFNDDLSAYAGQRITATPSNPVGFTPKSGSVLSSSSNGLRNASSTTLSDPFGSGLSTTEQNSFYIETETIVSQSLIAPASISPGETISFTCSFAPTSITASDGTSTLTLTNITNTSGDNYTADVPALPAVGNSLQYTTFGAVTMSATDGTDTAEDTTTLAAAAGQTVTILAATFDTSELSYLFNFSGTPATGDQFIEGSPQLALDANGGYVADTDGTYVITGIDATDGIAQSYNLILGDEPVDPPSGNVTIRFRAKRLRARPITATKLRAR